MDGFYHEIHNEPEKEQVYDYAINWIKSKLTSHLSLDPRIRRATIILLVKFLLGDFMVDFLFRGKLIDVDKDVEELIQLETERQVRKLILIPSESSAPELFENVWINFSICLCRRYPEEDTHGYTEAEILDYPAQLAHYVVIRSTIL
jgi:hypothetical protein